MLTDHHEEHKLRSLLPKRGHALCMQATYLEISQYNIRIGYHESTDRLSTVSRLTEPQAKSGLETLWKIESLMAKTLPEHHKMMLDSDLMHE